MSSNLEMPLEMMDMIFANADKKTLLKSLRTSKAIRARILSLTECKQTLGFEIADDDDRASPFDHLSPADFLHATCRPRVLKATAVFPDLHLIQFQRIRHIEDGTWAGAKAKYPCSPSDRTEKYRLYELELSAPCNQMDSHFRTKTYPEELHAHRQASAIMQQGIGRSWEHLAMAPPKVNAIVVVMLAFRYKTAHLMFSNVKTLGNLYERLWVVFSRVPTRFMCPFLRCIGDRQTLRIAIGYLSKFRLRLGAQPAMLDATENLYARLMASKRCGHTIEMFRSHHEKHSPDCSDPECQVCMLRFEERNASIID